MKNISGFEFSSVIKSGKVVVIFYGTGCLNCKIMQSTFNEIESTFPNVNFYKINADRYFNLMQMYRINSLPTMLLFRHGKMLPPIVGVKTLSTLKTLINNSLNYA
ncbi:MAG: thioredoxin family protein [Clostridia bacterium]|nr:thioredoxin family protein [Clostridia bacterium]